MTSDSLQKTKIRLQRSGKIGYWICRIIRILLIVTMIMCAAAIIMITIDKNKIPWIHWLYEGNAVYRVLTDDVYSQLFFIGNKNILADIPPQAQAQIGLFATILTGLGLWLFVRMIEQMMKHLAEAGRPFNVQTAKKMRLYSFSFLLLIIYNPLMGIVSFALALVFSYIMEYGGYIQEQADETNRIQEEIIVSFAEITENKSGQTGQHVKRVSEYSRILAEQMGLDPERCDIIRIASTMHDVGKLMIPSEILDKPGRLTDAEYAVIKEHTTYGGRLLENVEGDELKLSRTIAMQHHERYDGNGYPAHLSGQDISLEGRIVAVADVYDALTSRRSYKDAWSEDDAYQEILKGKGTQFDPQVVEAFENAHDQIIAVHQKFVD